jgi:hypothetical protein
MYFCFLALPFATEILIGNIYIFLMNLMILKNIRILKGDCRGTLSKAGKKVGYSMLGHCSYLTIINFSSSVLVTMEKITGIV